MQTMSAVSTHLNSMIKPPVTTVVLRSVAMENVVGWDGHVVILHSIFVLGLEMWNVWVDFVKTQHKLSCLYDIQGMPVHWFWKEANSSQFYACTLHYSDRKQNNPCWSFDSIFYGTLICHSPMASLSLLSVQVSLCSEVRIPTGHSEGSLDISMTLCSSSMMCLEGTTARVPSGHSYIRSSLKNCVVFEYSLTNAAGNNMLVHKISMVLLLWYLQLHKLCNSQAYNALSSLNWSGN